MSDSEESAAVLLERRRSYIISNRIVVNSQRVAFGQPKTSKVGGLILFNSTLNKVLLTSI